jgi:hypothetical protein
MAFPQSTDDRLIGAERNLSKVLIRLSIGIDAGPMLLLAQNTVCAESTGISLSTGIPRPTLKLKNKAKGKSIPNIRLGGRR